MKRYAFGLCCMIVTLMSVLWLFSPLAGRLQAADPSPASLASAIRFVAQAADEDADSEDADSEESDSDDADSEDSDDAEDSEDAEKDSDDSDKEEGDADSKKADSAKESDAAAEKKEGDEVKSTDKADAASADEKKPVDDEKQSDAAAEEKPGEDKAAEEAKSADKPEAKAADKPEAKKRKTHTVDTKRLKVEVPVDGTFVASEMIEIPLRPEVWAGYEIVEVVEHGAKVREGEVVVKFDPRKINEAIADLELEQRLNELAILRAEEELPRMEKTLALALENAERSDREVKEDHKRYNEIDRPMMVKSAEFTVKYYNFMVDYQREELEQLQKMYEADDLTEETEEIILKRQRNSVEFAEFSLESAKLNRDQTLNVRLPRYDILVKQSLERAAMELERAKMASTLDLNRSRYELEQRKQARSRSLDRHAKLLKDRSLMEIKSPAEGTVYYGQCVDGRWADMASMIAKMRPHNNAAPGSVLMTIVDGRPVNIVAAVDESKRPEVEEGQPVKITPPAEGSAVLSGKIKKVSAIPVTTGKFQVEFELDDELPSWIVAGLSCKARIIAYDKEDALVVPKAAVRTDEKDENQSYVWLVDADDEEAKPERRNVTLGKRSGDDVEIAKGLKKGDVISLEDEAAKAKEEAKS